MDSVSEIRREKVSIQPEMTYEDIQEKYGLSAERSKHVKKQGFFVKTDIKEQICPGLRNVGNFVLG